MSPAYVNRDEVIHVTNEPKDIETAYYTAGVTAVCLFGSFFLCCIWRSYISFPKFHIAFENKKMIIHISLTFFAFFELIYGFSFVVHRKETVWGYCVHMLGQYAVLLSFALVYIF